MAGLDGENREDIFEEQKNEELTQQEIQRKIAVEKTQEALVGFSSTAKKEILTELLKRTSAEIQAEQGIKFAALQPIGFINAPESAKQKRQEFVDDENIEKLQWIHDNVSYNADHTMNIIKLKKTFCEDVSGTGQRCDWEDAKALAESKGYRLPSDYNNKDSHKIRINSDWYKVINIFSVGKGDTKQGMELFRDMAGCNGRYWTSTKYENEENIARIRSRNENSCYRDGIHTTNNNHVCGLKNMNITT